MRELINFSDGDDIGAMNPQESLRWKFYFNLAEA